MTVHLLVLKGLLLAGAQTSELSAHDIEGAAGVVPVFSEPPHTILIQLVNANHHPFPGKTVEFVIPPQPLAPPPTSQGAAAHRNPQ